jgi:ATP/maltotriose-dependent transcriptional regulator MalT
MPHESQDLSERELEVLRLLAMGYSEHAIADRLVVSPATVHMHVLHIYQKLDVHGRDAAVDWYHAQGKEIN